MTAGQKKKILGCSASQVAEAKGQCCCSTQAIEKKQKHTNGLRLRNKKDGVGDGGVGEGGEASLFTRGGGWKQAGDSHPPLSQPWEAATG